jgi:hypothetical protein
VGKVLWSTTSACTSVPGSSRVRPLTPDLPSILRYTLSFNKKIYPACCYGINTRSPLKKYPRGVVTNFPKISARIQIRQINSAILKVPDGTWIR